MSKLTERWRFCYTQTKEDGGDIVLDLDLNFENATDEILAQHLTTFLRAAGRDQLVRLDKE
jgi:hypothetical protein